jgi:hypothetical protein
MFKQLWLRTMLALTIFCVLTSLAYLLGLLDRKPGTMARSV